MKKIPKNCLTCAFMDFADDELEDLRCHLELHIPNPNGIPVEDDHICDFYALNKNVEEDSKQGCW